MYKRQVNTHGVRGEVKVQPWDVSAGQLSGFRTFYMDGEPFRPTSTVSYTHLEKMGSFMAQIR